MSKEQQVAAESHERRVMSDEQEWISVLGTRDRPKSLYQRCQHSLQLISLARQLAKILLAEIAQIMSEQDVVLSLAGRPSGYLKKASHFPIRTASATFCDIRTYRAAERRS
jgi:hypothetical protein